MRDLPFRPAIVISIVSAFLQRPDGALAQPGILDPSCAGFGSNAFTTGEFFYGDHDTVVAPDGSVYTCGSVSSGDLVRAIVVHVQSNGLLDTGFGDQGFFPWASVQRFARTIC